jgi:cytochrome P450
MQAAPLDTSHVGLNISAVTPPMPPMASNTVGGLRVLLAIRHNAYTAFPQRCLDEPVVVLKAVGRCVALATSPDAIRHIMITHGEDYVRLPFGRRVLGPLAGNGLIVSEGETWREQRRAMAPAFTPRNVPLMARHIMQCTERSCERIAGARGGDVDLLQEMQALSLDIAATSLFSIEAATFGAELGALVTEYMRTIGRLYPTDVFLPDVIPTPLRSRRASFRRRWTALVRSIIDVRRKAERADAPRDLFDLLSEAHGADREDLLVDEVSTMIVAGHETTALALFWACTLLAQAPHWQERLAAEAGQLDLSVDGAAASLPKLVVTRAVVEETMRLYSPAFMTGRMASKSHDICGIQVPAGSIILLPYWVLHRSARYWKDPATFDPLRFLNGAEPQRLTYLPFGVGRHVCIGAQLAMSEAVLAIARLVRQFNMKLTGNRPVLPVGRISTRPDYSPPFVLSPRRVESSRSVVV